MAHKVKDILNDALALSAEGRAYVAEVLLESLDFERDFPINDGWLAEIHKRCREIDSGEVDLIPGEQAMAGMRARFP